MYKMFQYLNPTLILYLQNSIILQEQPLKHIAFNIIKKVHCKYLVHQITLTNLHKYKVYI